MSKRYFACLAFLVIMMASLAATAGASPGSSTLSDEGRTPSFFASWHKPTILQNKTGCTANLTCPNGAFISCSSEVLGTCTAGATYVDCNGARTDCPTYTCSAENQCCDGSSVYCEGNTCSVTARGVRCDGIGYLCPRCPFLP